VIVTQSLIRPSDDATFNASTRVLVRPNGLDMVEVGGSNPPGPTKIQLKIKSLYTDKAHTAGVCDIFTTNQNDPT